jgi:predicted metal-dependent phosphoesterase TrpH
VSVRIDLHTHSRASDGTQTPAELILAAHAAGLDVVAITDHDTTEGWGEAAKAAEEAGIALVRGIEISTKLEGQSVHLLAYLPDPTYAPLLDGLQKVLDGRNARVPAILARLSELGLDLDLDDVRRVAGETAAIGRPHVADALIAKGYIRDRDQAFSELLSQGRPAYVKRYAAPLDEMIRNVAEAGGVSVVAHPWGRHDPGRMGEQGLARLQELGLSGIEVDHQDHDRATRDELRAIARNLGLVATGSSDYHGAGKTGHDLGCNTTHPDEYARLLDLAAAASARSGRRTPEVLVA